MPGLPSRILHPPRSAEFEPLHAFHRDRQMGRGDDDAAGAHVVADQAGEMDFRRRIETGGRLVEQPDRTAVEQQFGDRDTAALAGRQVGKRQVAGVLQPDGRQRLVDLEFRPAGESLPEGQVLMHRQRRLHGVHRPEIMGSCGDGRPAAVIVLDRRASGAGAQQAGHGADQRRLAGAVRPGDDQPLAVGQRKIDTLEDRSGAAVHGKIAHDKLHGFPSFRRACRTDWRREAITRDFLTFDGLSRQKKLLYTMHIAPAAGAQTY
jgi:hypothetical protein